MADEKTSQGRRSREWLYTAVDMEPKLLLEVDVFSCHGAVPAAAFLYRFPKKHYFADSDFLVKAG